MKNILLAIGEAVLTILIGAILLTAEIGFCIVRDIYDWVMGVKYE